jgi:hypothetical protein
MKAKIVQHTYIFVIIVIVILAIIIVYQLIGPSINSPIYNFNAFPDVNPSDLSNIQSGGSFCTQSIQECDKDGSCTKCGNPEYECVQSDGNMVFNNMKVPIGKYCLPKGPLELGCNRYTGRIVWTKEKGWQCICAYPDLFTGDTCETQVACINSSSDTPTDQSNNYLVGTEDGPYQRDKWDPLVNNLKPLPNPYTYDPINKKPWFQCNCDDGKSDPNNPTTGFVNLPGDPYTCHLDPCWKSKNYQLPGAIPVPGGGYKCDCSANNGIVVTDPESDFNGLCLAKEDLCKVSSGPTGNYDETTKTCNCGILHSRACTSNYVKRTSKNTNNPCTNDSDCMGSGSTCDTKTGWCTCLDENNKIGQECVNPCDPNPCNGRGCTPKLSQSPYFNCDCNIMQDGKTTPPKLPEVSTCDTQFAGPFQSPSFGGERCNELRWPNGTAIAADGTSDCSVLPGGRTKGDKSDCEDDELTICSYSAKGFAVDVSYCGKNDCPGPCVIL